MPLCENAERVLKAVAVKVGTGDCEFVTVMRLLKVSILVGEWDSVIEGEPEDDDVGELLADIKDDAVGEIVLEPVAVVVTDLIDDTVAIDEGDEMEVGEEDSDEETVTVSV